MSEEVRLQLENKLLINCSKAQAINKYIDELNENCKLSELWCKSQQENEQLKNNWNELKKWIRDYLKLFNNPDYFEEQSIEDLNEVLNKMQELECSNENNKKR